MPWKTTFMEEGAIIVFVEAILQKLCIVGGILWETQRERKRDHTERREMEVGEEEEHLKY